MAERTTFTDGEPCWADVVAPDPEAARQFYGAVFGWTYGASGQFGGYTMCSLGGQAADGRYVAGITPPSPGSPAPAAWNLYFASADADATAARVERGGGKSLGRPMDVGPAGRTFAGLDPAGVPFGVWQGGLHSGFQAVAEPGAFAWAELHTREPAEDAFYRSLFDYRQQQIGDGSSFDYTVWSIGENQVCGRLAIPADADEIPMWLVYLAVDDADAAAGRVTSAGGTVIQPPFDSPYGRVGVVTDPAGAIFAIIDLARTAAP